MTMSTWAKPTDFKRDRWGRALIVPPDGGKPKPYGRPSSFGKKLEDTYGLEQWQRRMVTVGLARTPSLVARAATIPGDPKAWTKEHKDELNAIADEALIAAKGNQAADIGTSLHKMTELADLGEDVSHLPEPFAADVATYRAGMAAHGLEILPQFVECRMVCDALELAGTTDRIVWSNSDEHRIFDLKTGDSIELAALGYAVQLAVYAHSVLYDLATGERTPLPINTEVAYIGHLPAGRATFTLHQVDVAAGWEAALLCKDIDRWRKRKQLVVAVPDPKPTRPDPHHHAKTLHRDTATVTVTTPPDEGAEASEEQVAPLRQRYKAVNASWVNALRSDAVTARCDFHLSTAKTMRRLRITDGLVMLTEHDACDNDLVKALVRHVVGDDMLSWPTVTAGAAVGSLSAVDAAAFVGACESFIAGRFTLEMTLDGPRLTVAA